MQRCLQLAKLGAGNVAPNPMVGSVLVYNDRIIGEGYHRQYGFAHAEVNCINSVSETDAWLIPQSILYVSLEPCAHWGKTPPCADLIIRNQIRKVVVGCRDPFEKVDGKGIEKLRAAGVEVVMSALEKECIEVNKRFFTFHTRQRPYIILKWAQTADGRISSGTEERLLISNEYANRTVHKWRSEEASILVGTNTALLDNPVLNNRLWTGNSPVRLVLDAELRLPSSLHIFDNTNRTVIINKKLQKEEGKTLYYKIDTGENIVTSICKMCYQLNLQSLFIEGGARLLQSFIEASIWDETRIITNQTLFAGQGLSSPILQNHELIATEQVHNNRIDFFTHIHT